MKLARKRISLPRSDNGHEILTYYWDPICQNSQERIEPPFYPSSKYCYNSCNRYFIHEEVEKQKECLKRYQHGVIII